MPRNFSLTLFAITIMVLIAFAVLKYLQIPAGTLVDWVIGIVAFWWLIGITTIPWNMHFRAKEVMVEADISKERGITIDSADVEYAQKLSKRFWWIAVSLHVFSAAVLYILAFFQITSIGYMAALSSLLLTFFRPLQRLYEYIAHRLNLLYDKMHYPREDVHELRSRMYNAENQIQTIKGSLDVNNEYSWAKEQINSIARLQNHIDKLRSALDDLSLQNKREHELLSRKSEEDIARLSEDAQFLNQVREIIRFFKKS